ncbi:metal-dependent hydrolase [Halomicroarcula sp. GCM10025817]|uniref:metal-dependent hydrolase n=1 Tax=Halomicroarcula sp. GCM10025817 TaxID=3252672 RepID=UPI0036128136
MLPPAHLAIGYLAYSSYTRVRGRTPTSLGALFVVVGAMFPDIIDKPLQWSGLLIDGRTAGHSLLIGGPIVFLVGLWLYRRTGDGDALVALCASWLLHPIADGINYPFQGTVGTDFEELSFVVWPVEISGPAVVELLSFNQTVATLMAQKPEWAATNLPSGPDLRSALLLFQLCVTGVAAVVWIWDGGPGLSLVRTATVVLTSSSK